MEKNGQLQMVLRAPSETAIEEIQKAGSRAAGLTAQLLAFSRRQVIQAQQKIKNLLT